MDLGTTVSVIGILMALLSTILITRFYSRRAPQSSDLWYCLDFDVLMSVADGVAQDGLTIEAGGESVSRINRTRVAFWNRRGLPVKAADVLASDLPRLEFDAQDTILSARVLTSSRPQIGLKVGVCSFRVDVGFVFLDAGDGGIIEILHQGFSTPNLVGTVMGARFRERESRWFSRISLSPDAPLSS